MEYEEIKEFVQRDGKKILVATLLGGVSSAFASHAPLLEVFTIGIPITYIFTQTEISKKISGFAEIAKSLGLPDEEQQLALASVAQRAKNSIQDRLNRVVDSEDELPSLNQQQDIYYFAVEMLDRTPSDELFLAIGEDNKWHSLDLDKAYHILISAKTGNGKTTLIKQLLMQMVYSCECYFIHPMFARVGGVNDDRVIEVWDPIVDRLKENPDKFKGDYTEINNLFLRFELSLNKRTKEKGTPTERKWKKKYLFVDEGPAVVAQCPDAKRVIGRIVREGRQLGIFLALSTQGAQVQTLGLSTADLAQFGTKFYLGGCDDRTRREVMPTLAREDERRFETKGKMCFTAPGYLTPTFVQLPLMRNEELFECFGETFDRENYRDWFEDEKYAYDDPLENISHFTNTQDDEKVEGEITPNTKSEKVKCEIDDELMGKIIQAFYDLEEEGKPAVMNALWKKTGLNWRDNEKIEYVAELAGFEIEKGKAGRKAAVK